MSDGRGDKWHWARQYSDVSECIELGAVYDDQLKKDDKFTAYATRLAQRICEDLQLPVICSWGKWGSRIESDKNKHLSEREMESAANQITRHYSWLALRITAHVFTYGKYYKEEKCDNCGHDVLVMENVLNYKSFVRHNSYDHRVLGTKKCREDDCDCKQPEFSKPEEKVKNK